MFLWLYSLQTKNCLGKFLSRSGSGKSYQVKVTWLPFRGRLRNKLLLMHLILHSDDQYHKPSWLQEFFWYGIVNLKLVTNFSFIMAKLCKGNDNLFDSFSIRMQALDTPAMKAIFMLPAISIILIFFTIPRQFIEYLPNVSQATCKTLILIVLFIFTW